MTNQNDDPRVYSAMQSGKPIATYRKTVLGKIYVSVLSPFSGQPEGLILYGDPKTSELAYIDVWSEKENVYFKRANRKHLEDGNIILIKREEKEPIRTIEQYSDEELKEVIALKFIPFQKILSEITSLAVVYRLLELAREMEKSERIIKTIEAKVSELQVVTKPID